MIYNFDVPFTLVTPYSATPLKINEVDGMGFPVWPRYGFVVADCNASWQSRVYRNDVPAADGSILGKGFATGVELNLAIEPWEGQEQPACGALRTEMMDRLRGHLYALLKDTAGASRLSFDVPDDTIAVTALDIRMVDDIQLGPIQPPKVVDGVRIRQDFTLDSPFPYVMRENQQVVPVNATTAPIVMVGTAWFMPVIKIYGAFTTALVTHNGLGVSIGYDGTRIGAPAIGAGEYLEIDTFRNVATKVAGAVLTDAMAGITLTQSDFFPLLPGSNSITTTRSTDFLVNQAWA